MPIYRVNVVASYNRDKSPSGTLRSLGDWASAGHDRGFEGSHEIEPVRWTAKAIYRIDAPTPDEAEHEARRQFASESDDFGIPDPETIITTAD